MRILLGAFILLASLLAQAQDSECALEIRKTSLPMEDGSDTSHLCLPDYLRLRNLAEKTYDVNDNGQLIFPDSQDGMQMDDMMLFVQNPARTTGLGVSGRTALDQQILTAMIGSLQMFGQSCLLEIKDADKVLSVSDFTSVERTEENQPGTRLVLKSDDFKNPSWSLSCAFGGRGRAVMKSGNYFYFFVDTYENTSPSSLGNALDMTKYLFSFH